MPSFAVWTDIKWKTTANLKLFKSRFNLKQDVSAASVALQNHNKNEQIHPDAKHLDQNQWSFMPFNGVRSKWPSQEKAVDHTPA